MELSSYRVQLDGFGGPLDLLLHLVRRDEIDPCVLALQPVVEAFRTWINERAVGEDASNAPLDIDLGFVGEFVVTTGALLEIKSHAALPDETADEEDEDDVPADAANGTLVERLLTYQRLKAAAHELQSQAEAWRCRYPRLSDDRPSTSRDPARDFIKGVELWDLVSALARVLETKEVVAYGTIELDKTPMSVYQDRIRERIARDGRTRFSAFFEGVHDRGRIVGVFLAILELMRHHGYRAEQPKLHGEIVILPPAAEADPEADAEQAA